MSVHVSIHDVTPAWSDEVDAALRACHAVGVRPALLVVPDFHGQAPLLADPGFCARLRALQADGHEIYLHGYSHQSAPRYGGVSPGGRLSWLFAQRIASGGEAEMADVSEEQGRSRVERGERVLRDAGLRIDGFVAPAWSMPRWVIPWLGSRGYRYSEDHFRVYDPAAARSRASLVLNWATRSRWRLVSTVAFCRVAKIGRAWAPARIAIHPADMRFRLVRSEIQRMLDWARADVVQRGADLLA